jgi:hypothetical protein
MDVNDDAFLLNERVAPETIASKLAPTEMDVNDNAFFLDERDAPETFASKLAPTGTVSTMTRSF